MKQLSTLLKMLRTAAVAVFIIGTLLFCGCDVSSSLSASTTSSSSAEIETFASEEFSDKALSDETEIRTIDFSGLYGHSGTVTITEGGIVRLVGEWNGQIVIDCDEELTLILAGVTLTGSNCIKITQSDAVTILTESGTVNCISSASDSNGTLSCEPLISAKGRLIFGGDGTLKIMAYAEDAITSKRTVTIEGGTIELNAAGNGIHTEGEIFILGGSVSVNSTQIALNADTGRIYDGNITISDGTLTLAAGAEGIKAEKLVMILGGSIGISSGSDAVAASDIQILSGDIEVDTNGIPDLPYSISSEEASVEQSGEESGQEDETADKNDGFCAASVTVSGGSISADCSDEAIQADNSITITGGELFLNAEGDGISTDGNFDFQGGDCTIISEGDGIQSAGDLNILGGSISVTAGGGGGSASSKSGDDFGFGGPGRPGQSSAAETTVSCKGLKSSGSIYISNGNIDLSSNDDSIHCSTLCQIDGGNISIYASDDAIHSDDMIILNDGCIDVSECFEGIEAFAIEVNGGDINVRAVNDGVNANGSEGGMFGGPGGFPGQNQQSSDFDSISGETTTYYRMTGGTLHLVITGSNNNVGDGIDSNGSFSMSGGVLIVSTRGDTQEGAIDTGDNQGLVITGGIIVAGGASMMQEGISSSSTQCAAVITMDQQKAGTEVTILDSNGSEIYSAVMEDVFNCLVLTHPDMTVGNEYTVTYGSSSSVLDFTSDNVINSTGGFGMGGFPGGGGFGGGFPGGF